MRSMRFLRRALVAAGAAGVATLAATLPALASPAAPAATPPGWRVATTVGPFQGSATPVISAYSAKSAWFTWTALGVKYIQQTGVQHWNGTRWSALPLPASMDTDVQYTVAAGATSAKDLWLISAAHYPVTHFLHWNGSAWSQVSVPSWVARPAADATLRVETRFFSPSNIWVFSLDVPTKSGLFAAHYNGLSWTKVPVPVDPREVSFLTASDIWMLGWPPSSKNPAATALEHWNGRAWHPVALPSIKLPKGTTGSLADLLALGPKSVWAAWQTARYNVGAMPYLLHWNGSAWAKVGFKTATKNAWDITPDGHGGFWIQTLQTGYNAPVHTYHFSAGHWSEPALPKQVQKFFDALALIPGTTSLWAAAEEIHNPTSSEAILKYGA